MQTYKLSITVNIDGQDDPDARMKALKIYKEVDNVVPGAEIKLQQVYNNKPPRGVVLGLCLLFVFASVLTHGVAWGWPTSMYSRIASAAMSELPEEYSQLLEPYRLQILSGAANDYADTDINEFLSAGQGSHDQVSESVAALFDNLSQSNSFPEEDIGQFMYSLGLLAKMIADVNYPLNSDNYAVDEGVVADSYNSDIGQNIPDTSIRDKGVVFWVDPQERVRASLARTSRFYYPVVGAYSPGDGYERVSGITRFVIAHALQDIVDAWMTILTSKLVDSQHTLSLSVDKSHYSAGESILLDLSMIATAGVPQTSDLYIAFADDQENLIFLGEGGQLSMSLTPFRSGFDATSSLERILSVLVPPDLSDQALHVYALMVASGNSPATTSNWLSNLATTTINVERMVDLDLDLLNDEIYLYPETNDSGQTLSFLPLQRWDFMFTGGFIDDPLTREDESWTNAVIPGNYTHVMMYLGRDTEGIPWGVELTTSLEGGGTDFRILRFPEFESIPTAVEGYGLPVGPKTINSYEYRSAKRLNQTDLDLIRERASEFLQIVKSDWAADFPYQLEFDWSPDSGSTAIHLVDDGLDNGASCTDYWLSLFEDLAGVCIYNSRMTAAEFETYFTEDPVGLTAKVPDSLNPLPFSLTINQLINFGFYAVDPPEYHFSCGGSETGVPLPSRLFESPQLETIEPVPAPQQWTY